MCELLEHNYTLLNKHECTVMNFLRSKNIPAKCLDYDNVGLYGKVMGIVDDPIVADKHRRQFYKFCRQWHKHQGKLTVCYVTKIANRVEYYHNRRYNAMMRERRLARRSQKTTV